MLKMKRQAKKVSEGNSNHGRVVAEVVKCSESASGIPLAS